MRSRRVLSWRSRRRSDVLSCGGRHHEAGRDSARLGERDERRARDLRRRRVHGEWCDARGGDAAAVAVGRFDATIRRVGVVRARAARRIAHFLHRDAEVAPRGPSCDGAEHRDRGYERDQRSRSGDPRARMRQSKVAEHESCPSCSARAPQEDERRTCVTLAVTRRAAMDPFADVSETRLRRRRTGRRRPHAVPTLSVRIPKVRLHRSVVDHRNIVLNRRWKAHGRDNKSRVIVFALRP